jgi:hypothetical protein
MRWRLTAATLATGAASVVAGLLAGGLNAANPSDMAVTIGPGSLSSSHLLEFGWVDPSGGLHRLAMNHGKTGDRQLRARTIGYPGVEGTLVLYLRDRTCGATYYSDGSGDANHVTGFAPIPDAVSPTGWEVQMADAGPNCSNATTSVFDVTSSNLDVGAQPQAALKAPGS